MSWSLNRVGLGSQLFRLRPVRIKQVSDSTVEKGNDMLAGLIRRLFGGRSNKDNAAIGDDWKEWNDRRMASNESGQPFDEPAPVQGGKRGRRWWRGRPSGADAAAAGFMVGPHVDHHFGGHDSGGFGGGGDAGGGF